jgi:hypothetical protein
MDSMPDGRTALGMLVSQPPRLEVREQLFPVRGPVLAVVFGDVGEATVPLEPETARLLAAELVNLADRFEAEGSGDQN